MLGQRTASLVFAGYDRFIAFFLPYLKKLRVKIVFSKQKVQILILIKFYKIKRPTIYLYALEILDRVSETQFQGGKH